MIQTWIEGSKRPVTIEVANHAIAVRTRHRFYSLRRSLIAEGHEAALAAQRASISIARNTAGDRETAHLIVAPTDGDLDAALEKAGISIPAAPELDL